MQTKIYSLPTHSFFTSGKFRWLQYSLVIIILILLLVKAGFAEGTKQLEPMGPPSTANGGLGLAIYDGGPTSNGYRIPFAKVGCDTSYRLNVYVSDPNTEIIYFGLRQQGNGDIYYRFRDPDGIIVSGYDLTIFPTTGNPGHINNWSEANSGPKIGTFNPTGYTPLSIHPTKTGNYYIEFAANTEGGPFGNEVSRIIDLFDISVFNGTSELT